MTISVTRKDTQPTPFPSETDIVSNDINIKVYFNVSLNVDLFKLLIICNLFYTDIMHAWFSYVEWIVH